MTPSMMMQGQTTSPNSTKSILKQKSEDEDYFSKHNRRVRLFLESEQTLI